MREVSCSACGGHLQVPEEQVISAGLCPDCGAEISLVPPAPIEPAVVEPPPLTQTAPVSPTKQDQRIVFCSKCGKPNLENNFRCTECQALLHGPAGTHPRANADVNTLGGLIPYENSFALIAYYLGVFSLIPCLGLPLGIGAVIMGILGLGHARKNPSARGKVHAWVGIILGGLCALLYGAAFAAFVFSVTYP